MTTTALHQAIELQSWEKVSSLVLEGEDLDERGGKFSMTPLTAAICAKAPVETVTKLISPTNINLRCCDCPRCVDGGKGWLDDYVSYNGYGMGRGQRVLDMPVGQRGWGMGFGQIEWGKELKWHYFETGKCEGYTALEFAIRERYYDIIRVLVDSGADLEIASGSWELIPLQRVTGQVQWPADKIAPLISSSNINKKHLYIRNYNGRTVCTALHLCLRERCYAQAEVLLDHGADINICDDFNTSPLHIGVHNFMVVGRRNLVYAENLLLRLISDQIVNEQSSELRDVFVLHNALTMDLWGVAEEILKHGADINATGRYEDTPLNAALERGYSVPSGLALKLMSPFSINKPDCRGTTPLMRAVSRKRWDLVRMLLQRGAHYQNLVPDLPMTLQNMCVSCVRDHMSSKEDEAFEVLRVPDAFREAFKLKSIADHLEAKYK